MKKMTQVALMSAIWSALVVFGAARADTNLAAICKDATPPQSTTCVNTTFDVPKDTDIVKGTGGYYAQWAGFTPPNAPTMVCPVDIVRGATICPQALTTVARSVVATGAVSPGTLTLTWVLASDTSVNTATSVWLYSGIKGGTLTKIKQVVLPATAASLPAPTTPGTYSYGVSAANASGESAVTTTDYKIDAPAPVQQPPTKPVSLSVTK